jgi:hypothetical protein
LSWFWASDLSGIGVVLRSSIRALPFHEIFLAYGAYPLISI